MRKEKNSFFCIRLCNLYDFTLNWKAGSWFTNREKIHDLGPSIRARERHVTTLVSPEPMPVYPPLQIQSITKFRGTFSVSKCQTFLVLGRKVDRRKKPLNTFELRMPGLHSLPCLRGRMQVWPFESDPLYIQPTFFFFSFHLFFFLCFRKSSIYINYLGTSLL